MGAKAKKDQRTSKKVQRIKDKHKRKFSLSRSVNEPLELHLECRAHGDKSQINIPIASFILKIVFSAFVFKK